MSRMIIAKYVTPWKYRRDQEAQRLQALRNRDGDDCRRCRRPLRFDLPQGHDMGPKVEAIAPVAGGEAAATANLCLTHRRCHAEAADHTDEVKERIRRKAEAELLSKSRKRKSKAA
jgi:hypothetical protein